MAQAPAYSYQGPIPGQEVQYQQVIPPQATAQPAPQAPAVYPAQPAPAYSYAPQPNYQYNNPDEVRTVFVTGFPPDVKERELNNLMRFIPGYEASQMTWKNNFAQGFALFQNAAAAYAAIGLLNNHVFDDMSVLRCEMARKNMYLRQEDQSMKRPRTSAYGQASYSGSYQAASNGAATAAPVIYANVSNTKDNPPCSTLFVGNLGDTVSEGELLSLFSSQPGFVTLKLVRNVKSATAFVEFADLAAAMAVHDAQQGAVLQSSDRGGIRIQYSKNPFGKKRDHQGNPVDPQSLPPGPGGVLTLVKERSRMTSSPENAMTGTSGVDSPEDRSAAGSRCVIEREHTERGVSKNSGTRLVLTNVKSAV